MPIHLPHGTVSQRHFCAKLRTQKTTKLRNDITSFSQMEGESLHDAWEWFKELQRESPNHGIPDWLLARTFYNGHQQSMKTSIDGQTD